MTAAHVGAGPRPFGRVLGEPGMRPLCSHGLGTSLEYIAIGVVEAILPALVKDHLQTIAPRSICANGIWISWSLRGVMSRPLCCPCHNE